MTENGNRTGIVLALVFAVLVLCAGTAYLGYAFNQYQLKIDEQSYNFNLGKSEGEKIGHEKGYQEGFAAGVEENNGYALRDPAYQEMKDFLVEDGASAKDYVENAHICTDFTAEANNNAEAKGIRCATVYIIYPETGHSIIGFNTTDRGMIFIEPQYDREVKLPIGKSYSVTNNFIKPEDLDDTIVRYLIMW